MTNDRCLRPLTAIWPLFSLNALPVVWHPNQYCHEILIIGRLLTRVNFPGNMEIIVDYVAVNRNRVMHQVRTDYAKLGCWWLVILCIVARSVGTHLYTLTADNNNTELYESHMILLSHFAFNWELLWIIWCNLWLQFFWKYSLKTAHAVMCIVLMSLSKSLFCGLPDFVKFGSCLFSLKFLDWNYVNYWWTFSHLKIFCCIQFGNGFSCGDFTASLMNL